MARSLPESAPTTTSAFVVAVVVLMMVVESKRKDGRWLCHPWKGHEAAIGEEIILGTQEMVT